MRGLMVRGIVLGVLGLAMIFLMGGLSHVEALASCPAGTVCNEALTNTNITGVQINLNVNVNNTGATTVITVSFVSDNLNNSPLGIDQIGYQSSVAATVLEPGWSQASCPSGGCTMNGFGKFTSEIDNSASTDLSVQF